MAAAFLSLAMCAIDRPLLAHHSFAAEYDRNKPITLTGTVARIEWANPHVYFYVDVGAASGPPATWAIEGGAPNTLYLVARSMQEGAWGLVTRFESGGPEHPNEIIAMAKTVASYGGNYTSHIRQLGERLHLRDASASPRLRG